MTVRQIVAGLAVIAFTIVQDYLSAGADGAPFVDFSKLTRAQAAALQEVTSEVCVERNGSEPREVRRVKFKLADTRAALVDLGKHLGRLFRETLSLNLVLAALLTEAYGQDEG